MPRPTRSYSPTGDAACIVIRDNGLGMDEDTLKNLFTPFFSTKKKLGTGLGLALTHRVIHAHGGRIEVESAPDDGALFRIHLPLRPPAQPAVS